MGKSAIIHDSGSEGGEVEGKTVHTSTGTMRTRPDRTTHDSFHISDTQRKQYGIKDDETPYWARSGQRWEQYEGIDRQEQLSEELGARTVYKSGEMDCVKRGSDLVLMAIPTEVMEAQQQETDEASANFERDLTPDPQDSGIVRSHKDLFDRDAASLHARMRAEHEQNARTGFVGGSSPTSGLSLLEAEALMRRKGVDIKAMQAELRRGGRHVHMDQEQFQRVMTGDRESRKASKSVAMGNSGFPRNSASPLAQAQRREAKSK